MTRLRMLLLMLAFLVACNAHAAPHQWQLIGVTLDDGGEATGWIEIESTTGSLLAFEIQIVGGDLINFPGSTYSSTGGSLGLRQQIAAHPVDSFEFTGGDGDVQFVLRLTPTTNLENAAGESALDLAFPTGNLECQDCTPFRLIVSGSLRNVLFDDGFEGGGGGGSGGGGDGDG